MKCEYLILGGGIAGITAAETLRKALPDAAIGVAGEENLPLYSRLLLPHYIDGRVPREKIFLRPEDFFVKNNIVFFGGKSAVRIFPSRKITVLDDGTEIVFEKLLVATGARPVRPEIPGHGLDGVMALRSVEDADKIIQAFGRLKQEKEIAECAAVGSGFISSEFLKFFAAWGFKPHAIMRGPGFFHRQLDAQSMLLIENELLENNVAVHKNENTSAFLGEKMLRGARLGDGNVLPIRFAGVGTGLRMNLGFTKEAGLEVGEGIITNEFLETSVPGIWAAGDVAEFFDSAAGRRRVIKTWLNAQEQGRVAALNMAGGRTAFRAVPSHAAKIFNLPIVFIGDVLTGGQRKVFTRFAPDGHSVVRIITNNKTISGATLVGDAGDRAAITALIQKQTEVEDLEVLSDQNFDLKTLL